MNTVQVNKAVSPVRSRISVCLTNDRWKKMKVGLHTTPDGWSGIFRLPRYWKKKKKAHEKALELLSISI